MTAAEHYAALYDAAMSREWLSNVSVPGDPWRDFAELFRHDPHRPLDGNLAALAGYLHESDKLVDVGGGAGRVSLAMAGRVRQVELVEPSAGMRAQFIAARDEAGIANTQVSDDWWMESDAVGDVITLSDVTYFVRDIVPFVTKLHQSARRRVLINVWNPTPGDLHAGLHRALYGQAPPHLPGLPELAAVLWEMGLLPDIRPLPEPPWWFSEALGGMSEPDAIEFALAMVGSTDDDTRRLVESRLETLFVAGGNGLIPCWLTSAREVLITWETGEGQRQPTATDQMD